MFAKLRNLIKNEELGIKILGIILHFSLLRSNFVPKSVMSNDYFEFKQFTVRQSRCAMKVGTDGTLLGAWTRGKRNSEEPSSILDIGTGTGLIALMLAQRFPHAEILGIDIDAEACCQSLENVSRSPFSARIRIAHRDIKVQQGLFDTIVSNPPFFESSLISPDMQRTMARHTATLTYRDLMQNAWRLLSDDGEFSLIIPSEGRQHLEAEAALCGFFKNRECAVRTTPKKHPRRFLLAFGKHPVEQVEITEGIIETAPHVRSEWYRHLTDAFYL